MSEILALPLAAGLLLAMFSGPLGAFVLWRRMAYFGDALAHAALLGVAAGLALGISLQAGIFIVAAGFAALVSFGQRQRRLATDTLLGILAHGTLAVGLLLVSLNHRSAIDLEQLLLGDVLSVTVRDLYFLLPATTLGLAALVGLWRPLLSLTVDQDIARMEGVRVGAVTAAFMTLMALMVALAVKIVGVLLITALLIIPAAAARHLSRSPEGLAIGASLAGMAAVVGGLLVAVRFSLPAGPAIVVVAVGLFVASLAVRR